MHINIWEPLACSTAFLVDEALLSISLDCRGQLVKVPITLEPHSRFGSYTSHWFLDCLILHYNHCVSPSVLWQLVEMLITLEPHGILLSNFAYEYIHFIHYKFGYISHTPAKASL